LVKSRVSGIDPLLVAGFTPSTSPAPRGEISTPLAASFGVRETGDVETVRPDPAGMAAALDLRADGCRRDAENGRRLGDVQLDQVLVGCLDARCRALIAWLSALGRNRALPRSRAPVRRTVGLLGGCGLGAGLQPLRG
jgi:hypothetical protein